MTNGERIIDERRLEIHFVIAVMLVAILAIVFGQAWLPGGVVLGLAIGVIWTLQLVRAAIRKGFSLATLLIIVTVVALIVWAMRFFEPLGVSNLGEVRPGMTAEEVHGLIGEPKNTIIGLDAWTECYHWPQRGRAEVHYKYSDEKVNSVEITAIK